MRHSKFSMITGCLLLGMAISPAAACSVPVFRYALEHWTPEDYVVHVFHRGALTRDQRRNIERLLPRGFGSRRVANVVVHPFDVDGGVDEENATLLRKRKPADGEGYPWVLLQKPGKNDRPTTDVWSGLLTDTSAAGIVESPLRSLMARELIDGTSVVWVLLESGHREQDDAAETVLQRELERLQTTLKLPTIDPADVADLSIAAEALKLKFAAHRLSRDNSDEQVLVDLLLSVEPDMRLPEYADQPMAFPIFGRGCALYTLVGEGINGSTIEEACRFLVGGCQCTVKASNPGVDLLLAADWDLYVSPAFQSEPTVPSLVGVSEFGAPALADAGAISVPLATDEDEEMAIPMVGESVARDVGESSSSALVNRAGGGESASGGIAGLIERVGMLPLIVLGIAAVVAASVLLRRR